jgi:hypothetical protein
MKDMKLDNILVELRHEDPIHEQQAVYKTSTNPIVSPEFATLSRPLHEFSVVEIDNLIKNSHFHIQLTDFGTGKSLV